MVKSEVYFNLHKQVWSVRQRGKVVNHASHVYLVDATFVVQPAGRARVLQEQRKNVHAWVKGSLTTFRHVIPDGPLTEFRRVTYNPFKAGTFVDYATGEPVFGADYVCMQLGPDGKPQVWIADNG